MKKQISLRDFNSAQKRRQFLEKQLNIHLDNISQFSFTEEQVKGRNIENLIGATQIPLGVAGPIKVQSEKCKVKSYYIPLATTEGALVASASRGCKAISESGGAYVEVETVGATRGSVFVTSGIRQSRQIIKWLENNFKLIAKVAQGESSHLKLLKIDSSLVGKNLFLRFCYDSQDAMGLNMVTIANTNVAFLLEKQFKIKCVAVAGNYDIDKKPAWLNFILGRGKKVWAEIILKGKLVKEILKTTPEAIAEVVYRKIQIGSAMAGSLGFNAHYANVVAAIFAATGQDLAQVSEGSLGVTTAEVLPNGDLYFSVFLPDLMCGTVCGGIHLPGQQEALKLMSLKGPGDSIKYAQIVGSAILAVELSLIASLAEGTLAKAHQKLGRGKGDKKSI